MEPSPAIRAWTREEIQAFGYRVSGRSQVDWRGGATYHPRPRRAPRWPDKTGMGRGIAAGELTLKSTLRVDRLRKGEPNRSTVAQQVLRADAPTVRLDDRAGDR